LNRQVKRCLVLATALCLAQSESLASEGPLGLPSITVSGDAALIDLGRQLFSDKRLSADRTVSCATCHAPNSGYADGRARAIGLRGQSGTRNTPSLFNVAYSNALFWDGRSSSLEAQAALPLLGAREHGLSSESEVIMFVRADMRYRAGLRHVLGRDPTSIADVTVAIAAYERTLLAGNSPFDRYLYGRDSGAISAAAIRGLALFRGRARCESCHVIGSDSSLFTDQSFHASPIGLPADVDTALVELTQRVRALRSTGNEKELNAIVASDPGIAALGHYVVTLKPEDIGAFKTPSLRNVASTAPYFHDGSIATLEQAVDLELYSRGDASRYPIVLTVAEKSDLVAFLQALTSGDR
jgi:cytochrome c peroxidase